jgi:hypothetical protein
LTIVEKLTEEELALYEVLRDPVWFGEFVFNLEIDEEDEEPWIFTDYQVEFLEDFNENVCLRCGRAVGKTESIKTKIAWHVVNQFFDSILFTVPNRSHLDPVFLGIQKLFRTNPFLEYWIGRHSVNSQQFLVKFLNDFLWICRIAGTSGTGVNVVGLHVPIILLDEAAYYPWGTWIELLQVLNDWEPGHQTLVSGVPDGRRDRSVMYTSDTDDHFTKHRIPAHRNPRFTQAREEQLTAQYGGKESQDYIRQVLGEHGTPTFAVFDREFMRVEDYDVPVIRLYGTQLKDDSQLMYRVIQNLPRPPKYAEGVVIGVDLGYTQPTAIVALYQVEGTWYFLFRVELHQVSYDLQQTFVDRLDTKYNPSYIGIDMGAGGQGKSFYHTLVNDEKYKPKKYMDRLVGVEFGGTTVVGYDENGEELKERIKQFSASRLQQYATDHLIAFSARDDELISELEKVVYFRTATGQVQYKVMTDRGSDRGDDHNFAALLCFAMVLFERYENLGYSNVRKKLFKTRWLQ